MTINLGSATVGSELTPLMIEPISRYTLAMFAGASGDHNPIHIDSDVAHSAGLSDVFAHGMLSMAYLSRLLTNFVALEDIREFSVRFVSITPIHAQPVCTGVITSIGERDGERLAELDLAVTLSDGAVTLKGRAVIALPAI